VPHHSRGIRENPVTSTTPNRGRWTAWLTRRWPTALAVAPWALTLNGGESNGLVTGLGEALLLLPLVYLILAKVRRRRAAWPVLIASLTAMIALRLLDVVTPSTFFVTLALIVLIWGAVDGQLRRDGMLRIQALGMLGFGALALVGLAVDPDLGRYLVAAGWLFHGLWDFVHLRLDKVVARSYAEWCGVVDVLIAAQLIFLV
jgi:hypothetical protein